ncbi:hypothetical protein BAOM_3061 [Peribacillus asahii]|uniref:Uncharacterized protein n=1 Tax=Peribacillus asahii TaxID=228899 RepID=A0A3Q9RPC1_9BACI|nr:hypothetical protein [Peribacillus asahii]AZV43670.1 hypothetical protein BAOM_3061 [Peribacillus asahii]
MEKFLSNKMTLPILIFFVGIFNSGFNLNKTINEAWWYTLLPLFIGLFWGMAIIAIEQFKYFNDID